MPSGIIHYFSMLKEKIEAVRGEALKAFSDAQTSAALYEMKVQYLGKQGHFSNIMKEMGKLSPEERPVFGKMVNEVKVALEQTYTESEERLKARELDAKLGAETLDLTLPGPRAALGSQHPISIVIDEIVGVLARLGYAVRTGPLIEKDRYNFEALNIPKDHPARDMQDTFYIDDSHVLRTHTSPIQVHVLETEKPPLRILGVGPVFRSDSDVSHSPNFHQIEGMMVDTKVSMADLKGTISFFVREFFGKDLKTRFRPSFFPFTEPSAEVDCQCPICNGKGCRMCKESGWIEIGGSGLINPNVFKHAGVEYPKWQGFAFGFGVERMAVIKYGVDDIRLFNENDLRFLRQFSI
jgi:phenylalanyl-tRNA synthetase alpha chain